MTDLIETRLTQIQTIERSTHLVARSTTSWQMPHVPAWDTARVYIDADLRVWIDGTARAILSPTRSDVLFVKVGRMDVGEDSMVVIETTPATDPFARIVRGVTHFGDAVLGGGPIDADVLADWKPARYRVGALIDHGFDGVLAIGVRPHDWMGDE